MNPMEVMMHRMVKLMNCGIWVAALLAVLTCATPSAAMDSEPRAHATIGLVEVDAAAFEPVSADLDRMLAGGGLRVAAKADESILLYATPGGIAALAEHGIDTRLLLEAVGDREIYLVPMLGGIYIESLSGEHRVLSTTEKHYLIEADASATAEIHMLPFKKRLPDPGESGLPLGGTLPAPVRRVQAPLTYAPMIQAMVDSVSESRLYSTLSDLSGETQVLIGGEPYTINTRYSPTEMCKKAGQFILETFQAMGLEAEYDYFNWRTLMKGVYFPVDNQTGWAVGQGMSVLHTDDGGEIWIEQYTGDEGALNDIEMTDNSHGCIVGNNGIALVTEDGGTWQRVYPPTSNDLNNLYFVDDSTAFCCGEGGVILKTVDGGFNWSSVPSGTGQTLHGICFADPVTGWVVGMNGVIRKTENGGASWSSVSSPTGEDLYDVDCVDENACWACGLSGTVIRTEDGDTWEEVGTPVSEALKSVCFVNSLKGYACGKLGTMIKTLDGGATWYDLEFPDNMNLNDLHFVTAGEGWVVGLGALQHTVTGGTEWESRSTGVRAGDVNVVATMPGTTDPEEIYIICGHYDSISQMPETYAPGADDNGTGTVGVIEAARVLKNYSFESTLRFVCFSREEQGLVGSGAYAREARARGDSIVAALNFDMIGYVDSAPEDLDVLYNGISEWLADEYMAAAALYVTDLDIIKKYATYVGSDNSSFWDYNYPSFCGIEDSPLNNPYYHRTTDRISTLDFDFYTDVVQAAVATLAELARVDTTTSSVAGFVQPPAFRVGPNPGRGEITIEMTRSDKAPEAIRVFNVEGRLVASLEPAVDRDLVKATWDGTDLEGSAAGPGIYFVKVAGRSKGAKIVLLK
jgi:photosystem II stability/assembly factor-like uncharacterized protein